MPNGTLLMPNGKMLMQTTPQTTTLLVWSTAHARCLRFRSRSFQRHRDTPGYRFSQRRCCYNGTMFDHCECRRRIGQEARKPRHLHSRPAPSPALRPRTWAMAPKTSGPRRRVKPFVHAPLVLPALTVTAISATPTTVPPRLCSRAPGDGLGDVDDLRAAQHGIPRRRRWRRTFSTPSADLVGNYTVEVMLGGDEVGGSGSIFVGATAPLVETSCHDGMLVGRRCSPSWAAFEGKPPLR